MITTKEHPDTANHIDTILCPVVKTWFYSRFSSYSLPQLFAVSEIQSRKNILICAPTGATKTLTGFLSILNELVDTAQRGLLENRVYAIYVSPLKALNEDIRVNLQEPLCEIEKLAGKKLGIRVAVRTGDTPTKDRIAMLKTPPHILITTPESVAILLSSIKFRNLFTQVSWVIIDEIHAIAENKRGAHMSLSLERLSHLASHITRIGLSATVAPLKEIAQFLVGQNCDCMIVDVQFIKKMDLQVVSPLPNLIDTTYEQSQTALYTCIDAMLQEHRTTLIFTNTRAATERIVHHLKERYPGHYTTNIGAHHGSLSKEHRQSIESRLRSGELKAVVCSTSLELGIDIGYIDLVICLGSPKSVARALQRIGRSGHKLHETTKGRIIVMDRDDLVECAVLLKAAVERNIDRIHIPTNCLDVLAQHIVGMAVDQVWDETELYSLIRQSYCYKDLLRTDYNDILSYLAGEFADLEDRYIYSKIWRRDGKIGKRGKMTRVIYMTNIGTIPEESYITVKIGDAVIGHIDEGFLERLKPGDIFVLGGSTYEFLFAKGMTAQVRSTGKRPPTVPSWFSEMLPLSFDLAIQIGIFRRHMLEYFTSKSRKEDIVEFILHYLLVDMNAALAIYTYMEEQYNFCKHIPHDKNILVEHLKTEDENKVIFHTLYGRRVNDCLSRAVAFVLSRQEHKDIEVGISDNGFFIASQQRTNPLHAFELLKADKLDLIMSAAIEHAEAYRRRFRHCAARSLMLLRNYKGRTKSAGRQQVSSMILLKALERISKNFFILKEAKREVLQDLMDIESARQILYQVEEGHISIEEINTQIPSPFGFNLALQGTMDILKADDKIEFLRRMHNMVRAKIALQMIK
ncbi:MAG: ATP-dependent helicase [Nanoarchaeota archaeon]